MKYSVILTLVCLAVQAHAWGEDTRAGNWRGNNSYSENSYSENTSGDNSNGEIDHTYHDNDNGTVISSYEDEDEKPANPQCVKHITSLCPKCEVPVGKPEYKGEKRAKFAEMFCRQLSKKWRDWTDPRVDECFKQTLAASEPLYFQVEAWHYEQNHGSSDNDYSGYQVPSFVSRMVKDCFVSGRTPKGPIRIVGEMNMHSSLVYKDRPKVRIGGLSGVSVDFSKKRIYAISDDHFNSGITTFIWDEDGDARRPFRFYYENGFALFQKGRKDEANFIPISKERAEELKNTPAQTYHVSSFDQKTMEVDREDIVRLPDGRFIVSTEIPENNPDVSPPGPDSVYRVHEPTLLQFFSADGKPLGGIETPVAYLPKIKTTHHEYECWEDSGDSNMQFYDENGWYDGHGHFHPDNSEPIKSEPIKSVVIVNPKGEMPPPPPAKPKKKMCSDDSYEQIAGIHWNRGIEPLGIIPHSTKIVFGTEQPLFQDVDHSWFVHHDFVRIYVEDIDKPGADSLGHFVKYPIDLHDGFSTGLSALTPLNNHRILTLERGYDRDRVEGVVHVYLTSLNPGKDGFVKKKLLFNISDFRYDFAPGFRRIENFEGMTLGPVRNGKQILFLISDNNFSSIQRTALIAISVPQWLLRQPLN